jgi:hypothetical protein
MLTRRQSPWETDAEVRHTPGSAGASLGRKRHASVRNPAGWLVRAADPQVGLWRLGYRLLLSHVLSLSEKPNHAPTPADLTTTTLSLLSTCDLIASLS